MKWKPWIITGLCCLGASVICSTIAVASGALDRERYVEKLNLTDISDTITEPFSSVLVDAYDANIILKPGKSAEVDAESVSASEYTVQIVDDTLQIEQKSKSKYPWNRRFQIGIITAPQAAITVTLPEGTYRTIAVSTGMGNCTAAGLTASTISMDVDCGTCSLESVTAASCTIDCDMGDCSISDSAVSGTAAISMDCGNLELSGVEIGKICRMENSMGDIDASNVTCGSSEATLDCGSLTLTNYVETDETEESTFTLDMGDMQLKKSVLYGADIALDCGDLKTDDTALNANTSISVDLGDIRLNLRGKSSDYQVLKTFTSNGEKNNGNVISIDADEVTVDISVTFTES